MALAFLVALVANAATYYYHPHYVNYGPAFRLLSLFGYNELPLNNLFAGLDRALFLSVLLGVYILLREVLIYQIEQVNPGRAYRVLLANQVTAVAAAYGGLGYLLATFNVVDENFLRVYGLIIPPTLVVYLGATCWLFPTIGLISFLDARFVVRLLTVTFACTFPFAVLLMRFGHYNNFVWVVGCCWAGQVFVTVPLAWLLYRQQQDNLLQLRSIEQQLVQSAADLHRLRTQINPHFLFNDLNTLYGTALKEHAEHTAEGVQRLGDMMRFMLEDNLQDFIAMEQEIGYLNNYIALQKLRTPPSPTMCIEADIPSSSCSYQVAPHVVVAFRGKKMPSNMGSATKSFRGFVFACLVKSNAFASRCVIACTSGVRATGKSKKWALAYGMLSNGYNCCTGGAINSVAEKMILNSSCS